MRTGLPELLSAGLCVAAPLCFSASATAADICIALPGPSTFHDLDFLSSGWQCQGGNGAPDPNDHFVVPPVASIVVPASLTLGGSAGSIEVMPGGSLTFDGAQPGALSVVFGRGKAAWVHGFTENVALYVHDGGSVSFAPDYRPFGRVEAAGGCDTTTATTPEALGSAAYWRVGRLILCPGRSEQGTWVSDCLGSQPTPGDPNAAMVSFDLTSGAACGAESIAAIGAPDREWIQFARPGPDYSDQSRENGQWYRIADRGSDGTSAWLKLNVLQTSATSPRDGYYSLAMRRIQEQAVGAGAVVSSGDRRIPLEADLIATDNDWAGHWVYLEDPTTGSLHPEPFLIQATDDDPSGDSLLLADPRGVPFDLASGARLWITTFAIRPADPFLVIAPVRFYSATAAPMPDEVGDSLVVFENGAALNGVLFEQMGMVNVVGGPVQIDHTACIDCTGVSAVAGSMIIGQDAASTSAIHYLNLVGSRPRSLDALESTDSHGLILCSRRAPSAHTIEDSAFRYLGDDNVNTSFPDTTCTVRLSRVSCSYLSAKARSAGCIESSSVSSAVEAEDVVAYGFGTFAETYYNDMFQGHGTMRVSRAILAGSGSAFCREFFIGDPNDNCILHDVTMLGGEEGFGDFAEVDGFYLRELNLDPFGYGSISFDDVRPQGLRNGVLERLRFARTNGGVIEKGLDPDGPEDAMENVLVLDPAYAADNPNGVLRLRGGAPLAMHLSRVTLGWTPGWPPIGFPGRMGAAVEMANTQVGAYAGTTVDGLLVQGYSGRQGGGDFGLLVSAQAASGASWLGTNCFYDNFDFATGASIDTNDPNVPASRGVPLDLVDPAGGVFLPRPGGLADALGCGIEHARIPGITQKQWAHWMLGLEPESAAGYGTPVDSDADGHLDPYDDCPSVANGPAQAEDPALGNQTDIDLDGVGDACDNCLMRPNARVTALVFQTTTGGQLDDDADGFGNACDADFTESGRGVDSLDFSLFKRAFGQSREAAICGIDGSEPCDRYDLSGSDAMIDSVDFQLFKGLFGRQIGPKCSACGPPYDPNLPCQGDACP